jgi:hypothetical protein
VTATLAGARLREALAPSFARDRGCTIAKRVAAKGRSCNGQALSACFCRSAPSARWGVRRQRRIAAMGRSNAEEQALRIASGSGTAAPLAGSIHTITMFPSAYTQFASLRSTMRLPMVSDVLPSRSQLNRMSISAGQAIGLR